MSQLKSVLKVLKDNESTISTVLGALVVIVLAVLLFTSARNNPQNTDLIEPVSDAGTATAAAEVMEEEIETLTPTPEGVIGKVGSFIKSVLNPTAEPVPSQAPDTSAITTGKPVLERGDDGSLKPKSLPKSYTVVSGDTLWSVAMSFYGSGYNFVDIAAANNMSNADALNEGQTLTLPQVDVRVPVYEELIATVENGAGTAAVSYTVKNGDSLWDISVAQYGDGYSWTKIYEANKQLITDPGVIEPGWELSIPAR